MRACVLVIALAACNGRPESRPVPAPAAPVAPSAPAAPAAPSSADSKDAAMPTTILRPLAIPALGIDALAPAGQLREDTLDGTVSARIVDGPVRFAFAKGPGATLDQLRASLPGQVTFEPEVDARLCGQPARRLVAHLVPPIGTGARRGPDGQLEHQPGGGEPTSFVAVATQRNGTWIRAVWIVATARRADHAADEANFFLGLRCR
jgi:hypothetical protein